MEPSGVGGMGEQFEERCTESVSSLGPITSYLSLMASVAPQYGFVQQSSLASLYNHKCSIDQMPHMPPSIDSIVEEQPFPPNCSRSDEEMPFASFGEDYSGDESDVLRENEQMKHNGQEIACGYYSSADEDTCQRMPEHMFVAGLEEDYQHQYYGNKSDTVSANQLIEQIERDVAVGYSSAEDGPCKPVARWGRMSPLANNESIMGAVEQAMRNSSDGPKEHMFLPKVGAVFPSLGDAYQFYNLYSWEVGLSIRKGTNQGGKKNSDGTTHI